jgi:hypothetical protein
MARSLIEARSEFDAFVRLEPRLDVLWELCEAAAPPSRQSELVDDAYDLDPFESDPVEVSSDDGWCAEDFFLHHVKSRLMLLVGAYRPGPPHELHSSHAYDTVYDLLIQWALHRPCACCNADQAGDGEHASW